MEPIRTLIVDDEPYSRAELKHLLSSYPFIRVVGEADSGETAIIKAIQQQVEVVFLDVEMPKMNGMKTAKALMELNKSPFVVFATAYPQFAVEAFRYDALDYILKPYDEEHLAETLSRIEKKLSASKEQTHGKSAGKIAIDTDGEIFYIDPRDILYLVRNEKSTKLITKGGDFETKSPLKDFEARLVSYDFFRIHKSFLVNLEYVMKLTPWFNGAYQLQIEGNDELLPVSRNYAKSLRSRLEI